ncbi:transferase hexapeptide (six repeat-containing protein) [Desulfocicer vacuolatum DSM 3385]|uniref:Transferase hexapeptide (Six repeat-containing protein) n=1 Tax=Desulfocicer vacuolatum DSM 3385 TaxID=1121400 RepID=A0A1W1Z623_9BACT|nr:hypothetical protein [Desulfocicer vacuolatum]SMC43752.1 transferase hexapeptide (six repeat-containing protein) [Desulfocicer vacuolatum DSM 3385]
MSEFSKTSIISSKAILGKNVVIGDYAKIFDNVVIGDNVQIDDYCQIGHPSILSDKKPVIIGSNSHIRSFSIIYENSEFGPALETGHHVVIREGTMVGENLRVGNFSDIEGDCVIGDYCRFHGYSHIGKGAEIGHFVWIFSLVTATNDPLPPSNAQAPVKIKDGAVVCVGATLMPGSIVGTGAFISAGAQARGDVPAGAVIAGEDGKVVNHVSRLIDFNSGQRHPWMNHYRHVYPNTEEITNRLDSLLNEIMINKMNLKIN